MTIDVEERLRRTLREVAQRVEEPADVEAPWGPVMGSARRPRRLIATAAAAIVVAVGLGALVVARTGDGSGTVVAGPGPVAESFDLPFGLVPPEGAVPVGRPAVFERTLHRGGPVTPTSLWAAYRITGDDPPGVVRAWLEGLDSLAIDEVSLRVEPRPFDGPEGWQPWIQAESVSGGDSLDVQLWATGEHPILLVSIQRSGESPPRQPTVSDTAGQPPAPPSVVNDDQREAGDELFAEQGHVVHLPRGTSSLMPTLPTRSGTGGSTSVIAAEDAEAAVRALLDEATSDGWGEVTGPEVSEFDGIQIIEATFDIPAGGWGFDVVAVGAPQDPYATVYVMSTAD